MAFSIVGIGPTWLDRRQMGFKNPLGTKSHIYEQMYSKILPYGSWDHTFNNTYMSVHGGVFCLEFSPEGSLLVAACEKKSVLMFDPLTHKRINSVENAHSDCVNCIKFLDSRSFATCSDDFTVALWDARNLSQKVRSLKGHSNWVKNIEYCPHDGLLVTSGFDGNILTWEMNTYTEHGTVYNKVFSTNGLMRTCLTPDSSKMIICTTGGYLIIIHNLNLNTLSQDLDGFKPNMYRLMQLSQTLLPMASDFTDLFRGRGKRNRVEFITDFPDGDDAEVVSSLHIHPDGHCAISRNVSNNEKSEWSCIHNIEESLSSEESEYTDDDCDDTDGDGINGCQMINNSKTSTSISTTPSYIIQHSRIGAERSSVARTDSQTGSELSDLTVSPSDVWEALVAIQEARVRREAEGATSEFSLGQMFRPRAPDSEMQWRPSRSDIQLFLTRFFPNSVSNGERRESLSLIRMNSSRAIDRENVLAQATHRNSRHKHSTISCTNFRSISTKPAPVRQRYASPYRRSMVGLYDRTSILRKPIFNRGILRVKLKKLKKKMKLNVSREMNRNRFKEKSVGEVASRLSSSVVSERISGESSSRSRLREASHDGSGYHKVNFNETASYVLKETAGTSSGGEAKRDKRIGEWEGSSTEKSGGKIVSNSGKESENQSGKESIKNRRSNEADEIMPASLQIPANTAKKNSSSGKRKNKRHNSNAKSQKRLFRNENDFPEENGPCETNYRCNNNNNRTICNGSTEINSHGGRRCTGRRNRTTSPVINAKIHQNTKRLTHYVEEPNLGRGFIKELCASPDGRIVCSPFGNGIRLLSFSPSVQDMLHCYPISPPVPLHELALNIAHTDIVVSTKFSPCHNLLVSGCLSGKIVYYQPFF